MYAYIKIYIHRSVFCVLHFWLAALWVKVCGCSVGEGLWVNA